MQRKVVAVVTGDVNRSSRMDEEDARHLEQILRDCFQDVISTLDKAEADGFTIFRGDSWQFVVGEPVMAIRSTLFFRSSLLIHSNHEFGKRMHTSASIGFGNISYLPSDTSLSGGGEAYEISGKRLDKLRRRVPGMGVSGLEKNDIYLDRLLGVIDALVRHWTALQAKAVFFALQGLPQAEIAKRWDHKISQQAVHKHLSAAGWPAIEPALRWIETIIEDCIQENNLKVLSNGETHAN